MNRRQFLQAVSASILGAASLGLLWRSGLLQYVGWRMFVPRLDSDSSTGSLSADELETLVSFGEVLAKGSALSVEEREYLVEHIAYRTRNKPGYLSLYQLTARHLDHLAQGRFAKLDLGERSKMMISYRLTSSRIRAHEYLFTFHRNQLAIRRLAITDLISGFYRSPAGWALVGYTIFPGRCGDLIRYTEPESA